MGVKRESEMIAVKVEERENQGRGKKREDGSEKQGGEKRGKRQDEFFSSTHLLFPRLCWRRGLYFDLALRLSRDRAR